MISKVSHDYKLHEPKNLEATTHQATTLYPQPFMASQSPSEPGGLHGPERLMLHPLFTVTKKMEQSPVHL